MKFLLSLILLSTVSFAQGAYPKKGDFAPFPLDVTEVQFVEGVWESETTKLEIFKTGYVLSNKPLLIAKMEDKTGELRSRYALIYYENKIESYAMRPIGEGHNENARSVEAGFYRSTKLGWGTQEQGGAACRMMTLLLDLDGETFVKDTCI